MLERFRGLQTKLLTPLARWLVRAGARPNWITWLGTITVSLAALLCFPAGWLWQGAIAVAVCSSLDMVDGHMARESGPTRWGAFLDSSLDRVADAAILGGIAWHFGAHGSPVWAVATVVALVAAQLTSYVRARAEAVGASASSGIVTRADRVALAVLGTFLSGLGAPWALEITVAVLCLGGIATVIQRFAEVRAQLV